MHRVDVASAQGDYAVLVGEGLLDRLPSILADEGLAAPSVVVSNETVGPLYGRRLAAALACPPPLELADGEEYKRWPAVETTCSHWLGRGVHRSSSVLAVGGGVVTDTVGFAAAVYQRGIRWLAVPTSLLAMVDAAVGGKTGVNLEQGKNLVGAFWPPRLVAVDVGTLATLEERELRAGLVELVKAAWIGDHDLLALVPRRVARYADLSPAGWCAAVVGAVRVKAEVVAADEREAGRRKALNLGHTLGHALEAATGYTHLLHGEAVAWGTVAVARLAAQRGLLSQAAAARLEGVLRSLGPLPGIDGVSPERVLDHLARDKKLDDQGVAWVLPTDDGVVLDQRVGAEEARRVLLELQTG
jgi:3-dehydroquinate synthase